MTEATASASSSTGRGVTVGLALALCALLGALWAPSTWVVRQIQRGLGLQRTPPQARAWLTYPQNDELGVAPGTPLFFDVVAGRGTRTIAWRAVDGGRTLATGRVQSTPGEQVELQVGTGTATPRSWVEVYVAGIPTPLKVWVT